MAAVGATQLGFVDVQKMRMPNGQLAAASYIARLLNQTNGWTRYAMWKVANKDTCEQVIVETSQPDAYWVTVGRGVPLSKATTAQLEEGWGILESRHEIPRHLARGQDLQALRMNQITSAAERLRQEASRALFYGNGSLFDEQFNGIAPRYGTLSGGNSQNVISLGGASANAQTSIYATLWHENGCYMITPPNVPAGIEQLDLGLQTDQNAGGSNLRMEVWGTVVNWALGLCIKDWRHVGRVCNIDAASLVALSGNQTPTSFNNILHGMSRIIARMPKGTGGRLVFHGNRLIFEALHRIAMEKSSSAVTLGQAATQFGDISTEELRVFGVPFVLCDAIVNTEAVVS